ncbi:uncharacterized protein Z519_11403 [Cladophialophora bantiana CBS 173.52]|uniref:Major facilitator superfamily (MFS) profile domain-containing protein n=1 Tax=Cladophialophora bantiana (strain ATCC 10958 / CBS 173.52 / CDC B-1940 / NIH 8579) TaxID=1442370 RepID=A0A0D2HTP7_CLAB1|nr:uncharacterized protein Z519_11403 [Cladophialophora bantiana CBS 173.52]KIW87819.1 hypothetical protein Z519_11403 [Cladophialophora bantiana CBS 173.52]
MASDGSSPVQGFEGQDRKKHPGTTSDRVVQTGEFILELRDSYVKHGLRGTFQSKAVVLYAFVVRWGGFLFGYDQGVVSAILVMDQILDQFPRVSESASGAGFWKGLMTAMIGLGALIGGHLPRPIKTI